MKTPENSKNLVCVIFRLAQIWILRYAGFELLNIWCRLVYINSNFKCSSSLKILDEGTQVGWNVRGADKRFDVVLSRIRGHLLLLEMGYEDKWNVDEMLDNGFDLVRNELNSDNPGSSPLFKDVCPAGRMQQIETELMRYKIINGDVESAAKIAIRMLVEDSCTIQISQLKAIEVLVLYVKGTLTVDNARWCKTQQDLEEYKEWLEDATIERDRRSTSDWDDDALPETLKKSVRKFLSDSERESSATGVIAEMKLVSFRASTRGEVTMEVF